MVSLGESQFYLYLSAPPPPFFYSEIYPEVTVPCGLTLGCGQPPRKEHFGLFRFLLVLQGLGQQGAGSSQAGLPPPAAGLPQPGMGRSEALGK